MPPLSPLPPREYHFDIVFCLDVTDTMNACYPIIADKICSLYEVFSTKLHERSDGKDKMKLRVRIVAFKDYMSDMDAMTESDFFELGEDLDKLKAFLGSIEVNGGGDPPENALEALTLAIRSDWTPADRFTRHLIVLCTDAPPLELRAREWCSGYPADMPKDLNELRDLWEEQTDRRAKRLLIYGPKCEPWEEMGLYWSNTLFIPLEEDSVAECKDLFSLVISGGSF